MISVTTVKSVDAVSLIFSTVLLRPERNTYSNDSKQDIDLRSFECVLNKTRNVGIQIVVITFEKGMMEPTVEIKKNGPQTPS